MTNAIDRLAADVQPEEFELMRPALNTGRSIEVHGRTGVLSFDEIKVGFGTLYRVTVTLGAGTAVPADDTCRDVIAMLGQAGRLVPATDLDPEPLLETPSPSFV